MVVLSDRLTPTEQPSNVSLSRNNDQFKPENVVAKTLQQRQQQLQDAQQQDYVKQGLERVKKKSHYPILQPGARAMGKQFNEPDPREFQTFYNQLGHIVQQAQQQTAAARAKSAYERMQNLQDILSQQPPQFSGATYKPGNFSNLNFNNVMSKSAPLGMLGSVVPHAERAAREVSGLFGIGNIGGYATSGHIQGSDHYTGRAIDVMLGNKSGYPVVNYLMQNSPRLKVKYLIYNNRYWEPGSGWEPYTGSNPHTSHVHASFY